MRIRKPTVLLACVLWMVTLIAVHASPAFPTDTDHAATTEVTPDLRVHGDTWNQWMEVTGDTLIVTNTNTGDTVTLTEQELKGLLNLTAETIHFDTAASHGSDTPAQILEDSGTSRFNGRAVFDGLDETVFLRCDDGEKPQDCGYRIELTSDSYAGYYYAIGSRPTALTGSDTAQLEIKMIDSAGNPSGNLFEWWPPELAAGSSGTNEHIFFMADKSIVVNGTTGDSGIIKFFGGGTAVNPTALFRPDRFPFRIRDDEDNTLFWILDEEAPGVPEDRIQAEVPVIQAADDADSDNEVPRLAQVPAIVDTATVTPSTTDADTAGSLTLGPIGDTHSHYRLRVSGRLDAAGEIGIELCDTRSSCYDGADASDSYAWQVHTQKGGAHQTPQGNNKDSKISAVSSTHSIGSCDTCAFSLRATFDDQDFLSQPAQFRGGVSYVSDGQQRARTEFDGQFLNTSKNVDFVRIKILNGGAGITGAEATLTGVRRR